MGVAATALVEYVAPNEFLRGAIVGAGIVFVIGGLAFAAVLFTGTGPLTMGATGEMWTSSELRPLRKHGWKLVDHVFYRYRDIDHLLVGPCGAIVVESKWSAKAWTLNPPEGRLLRHVEQAQRTARDLRLAVPQLRQREDRVRPVLFLWGGGRTGVGQPTEPARIDGTDVVYGVDAAKAWRDQVSSASALFDESEIGEIWKRVRTQAVKTDELDRSEPAPPTLSRVYWTVCATLIATFSGVLGVLYSARLAGRPWGGYAFAAAAVLLGAAARPAELLRYPALGWLTGVGVITLALIALQLYS